jgi:BCD family chlorophyll transporter-like MFS transporter
VTETTAGFAPPIGWFGILRLGLVQAAIGGVVVLATSTLNRVMAVELALPATLPGALVALHYLVQIARPRFGHGSDLGGRRTPWIIGGMAVLGSGGILASGGTALMLTQPLGGLLLAVLGFVLIGMGVGAAGTSLLVLLAESVEPARRAPAASIVWVMMIAGFVITAGSIGHFLDPFSFGRLISVSIGVSAAAFCLSFVAVWGIEGARRSSSVAPHSAQPNGAFMAALKDVWRDRRSRDFALFVFISMLGYSAQELILEPFGGAVFGLTPGETAQLTETQHGGALVGMIAVALAGSTLCAGRLGSVRLWTLGGCLGSAAGLMALALGGLVGPAWPLKPTVFALGLANGAFAVSAIGAMMGLAGDGKSTRAGVRMGVWGAAQAVAFALGGVIATIGVDLFRYLLGSPVGAYALVFVGEAILFVAAAGWAGKVFAAASPRPRADSAPAGVGLSRG